MFSTMCFPLPLVFQCVFAISVPYKLANSKHTFILIYEHFKNLHFFQYLSENKGLFAAEQTFQGSGEQPDAPDLWNW